MLKTDVRRIAPAEARPKVLSGEALLVCGYAEPEKFEKYRLEGALSWPEFQSRKSSLAKDREILVYCA